jgi:nucleoside-diphosphate-sugar epimerase
VRIVVTGAAGRLGRALTKQALAQGHQVVAVDREPTAAAVASGVHIRAADITEYADLAAASAGCDAVIHLAAYTTPAAMPEPIVHNNNVVASYNALRAAEANGITRVCLASSVNAIGGKYSRQPRYDYFPVDEQHACYPEDSYSLSKRIAEEQAAAYARRVPSMSIGCLRLHALGERAEMAARLPDLPEAGRRDLWGYTPLTMAAQACLAVVAADLGGCEVFYVVAADTYSSEPSRPLRDRHFPDVPVRGDLSGCRSFFDSAKAAKMLGRFAL